VRGDAYLELGEIDMAAQAFAKMVKYEPAATAPLLGQISIR